jgi:hypothetical protein
MSVPYPPLPGESAKPGEIKIADNASNPESDSESENGSGGSERRTSLKYTATYDDQLQVKSKRASSSEDQSGKEAQKTLESDDTKHKTERGMPEAMKASEREASKGDAAAGL